MSELLKLTFFGAPQISLNGRSLNTLITGKHLALFAYLATTSQVHMRDVLADLLWSEMSNTQALKNLRDVVADLRKVVGDHLDITRQTLAFNRDTQHWLDVEVFRNNVLTDVTIAKPALLQSIVDLYQREFMAGFVVRNAPVFEEWMRFEREQLRSLAVQALNLLGGQYLAQANYEAGLAVNGRWLALDPEAEEAHRQRMHVLAASGQRSAALAQYELCRRLLDEEFGVAPAAETSELYKQIKSGEFEKTIEPANVKSKPGVLSALRPSSLHLDVAELPKTTLFCGREDELVQLEQWLVADGCRLVGIFGMGGQGKTALAAHLVRSLAQEQKFERIFWQSLLNAPPLTELLPEWIRLLTNYVVIDTPKSIEEGLTLLFEHLAQQRCLLVLDNVESILQSGDAEGAFRPGYAAYGQLIEWIGSRSHNSCLLITGREQPPGFGRLAQDLAKVQQLHLGGLPTEMGRKLLQTLGVADKPAAMATLSNHYSGNPLALRLVATTVRDFFAGDLTTFLSDEAVIFDDIRQVLDQHFARLSVLEQTILYWLTLEREPIVFATLWADLVEPPPRHQVLDALRSLQRRSLVERFGEGFGLQNVVTEYATGRLIEIMGRDLLEGRFQLFNSHALVKAQAKDYVRESQQRIILQPLAEQLNSYWGKGDVASALRQVLARVRTVALTPGYAAANLLNLLLHYQLDLRGYDFSQLPIWQADLRRARLRGVNFAGADLKGSVFIEALEATRSLRFSPDGEWLATGAEDGEVRLWRLADRQPMLTLRGHRGPIYALAFSADGSLLASAGSDHTVQLWELATGRLQRRFQGHLDEVLDVDFIAQDQQLLTIAQDGAVWRWPIDPNAQGAATFLFYATPNGQPHFTIGVAISRVKGWVAAWGADMVIRCWDFQSGQLQRSLIGHTDVVTCVAFQPDGKKLASCSNDKSVRFWPIDQPGHNDTTQHTCTVLHQVASRIIFSADGRFLLGGRSDVVWILDTQREQFLHQMVGHSAGIFAMACHPNGRAIASASLDQTVRIWDIESRRADYTLIGVSRWMDHVKCSPDGATLASSQFDHTVHLWSSDGQYRHALIGHQSNARILAFSPDGQRLATGSDDWTVRLWDVPTGRLLFTLRGHTASISGLIFSPDGRQLISGSHCADTHQPTGVCVWDVATGTLQRSLPRPCQRVFGLAFHPDGVRLAIGSVDQTVSLWDMQADRLLYVLEGHTSMVRTLAFHPTGHWLASGGDDKTIHLWNVAEGHRQQTLTGHTYIVSALAFTPDGQYLVSAGADQTIRIWAQESATGTWQLRHLLPEAFFKSDSIVLSPDSRTLVSGSMDTNVHLWDIETGEKRHTLQGHTNLVTAVHIRPDGAQAVSSSGDGTLRLWDTQTGLCLGTLRTQGLYAGMDITGATGISAAQRASLHLLGAVER